MNWKITRSLYQVPYFAITYALKQALSNHAFRGARRRSKAHAPIPGNNLNGRHRKGKLFIFTEESEWRAWTRRLVETLKKLGAEFVRRHICYRLICLNNSRFFQQTVVLFQQYTIHFLKGGFHGKSHVCIINSPFNAASCNDTKSVQ